MIHPDSIYTYIKEQEAVFDTDTISVFDNWQWSFRGHVQMSLMLKHGIFTTGENDWTRPFKKVIEPLLNLRYRAEDIEVKDILLYADAENGRALSFLIKRYHDDVYVKEHNLDELLDDIAEEEIDLGGVLVQEGKDVPEVMPLQFISFCDQTDILGSPIGFKYYFSPEKLRTMSSRGWGDTKNGATMSLDDLIALSLPERDPSGRSGAKKNQVPGKQIEVYIVRGSLPKHYLDDSGDFDDYPTQLQIVSYYTDKKNKTQGVTLYRKKEKEGTLKFYASKKVRGRALGVGGAEMLFHQQIWTNFLEVHKHKFLEAISASPFYTDDPAYANRNHTLDVENNEITVIEKGSVLNRVPSVPAVNFQVYENSINTWFEHAQLVGSAHDVQLGKQEFAGQTFRGQERLVQEGNSIHLYRRGKRAKFLEEVYRDYIIPKTVRAITGGTEFLATLSPDDMQWITERIAKNRAQKEIVESILNGDIPEDEQILIDKHKEAFARSGNIQKLSILKDEFKNVKIKININVAGKQKDLAALTDKILSIFQFIFQNPQGFMQVMQIPGMSKSFSDILEFSGINPVNFAAIPQMMAQQIQPQQGQPQGQPQQSK